MAAASAQADSAPLHAGYANASMVHVQAWVQCNSARSLADDAPALSLTDAMAVHGPDEIWQVPVGDASQKHVIGLVTQLAQFVCLAVIVGSLCML